MLFGDIESIQRVEQCKSVSLREQRAFPCLPGRFAGDRLDGFNHDHLGPVTPPVASGNDVGFRTLDIDLQEIDRFDAVRSAKLGQCHHRELDGLKCDAKALRFLRVGFNRR